MATESERDKTPLRYRGLSNVFSIWITKRLTEGKRKFRNEQDMKTAVYLANRQGAVKYADAEAHVEAEKR